MLTVLYVIAIIAEAMTAALTAGRRNMDWMGVCLLGGVTALGGGSLRDVLLGHYPLSWVQHPEYLCVTAGAALLAIGALISTRIGLQLGLLPWEAFQRLGIGSARLMLEMSLDRVDLAWLLAGLVVAVVLSLR